METLLEGLAETWGVLSGIVIAFVGPWFASKPSRWLERRKKRKDAPSETVFLDDKTLEKLEALDAGSKSQARTPDRRLPYR